MFRFAQQRPSRKPSLTAMVDVVFLLLIFFMLASQYGRNTTIPVDSGNSMASDYLGPPRLVEIYPDRLALNGVSLDMAGLLNSLKPLVTNPDGIIVLRGQDGANVQRVIEVTQVLRRNGYERIALVE